MTTRTRPTGTTRTRRRRSRAASVAATAVSAVLVSTLATSSPALADEMPFRDPSLPLDVRVDDLVERLTLEEKVAMLHQWSPGVPRLGVPAFRTGTEALHGVAWLGEATVFPQAIGLGTTWDPELLQRVGEVVGTEVRGYHSQDPATQGLNVWAPVVDMLRDPRWGRNEEGYSEDPYLTGVASTAYTRGLAGDDLLHLRTAPNIKHFTAYGNEAGRDVTNAVVPPGLLRDYYQEAFRPAIEAGTAVGVMPSYNLVNGRPSTVAPELDGLLQQWAPLPLMHVTDAFAPTNLTQSQDYFDDPAQAHAAALRAGINSFTDNAENSVPTVTAVTEALERGLVSEADVEEAVSGIISVRVRLGDFDPEGTHPYDGIGPEVIATPEHGELAREAAAAQVVLLENEDDVLPLDAATAGDVAVVGPLGDVLYEDWYSGTMPYEVTALDGIAEQVGADAVTAVEGVDRIALRERGTGRVVTAGTGEGGAALAVTDAEVGDAQSFGVTDWGAGVVTLRAAANDRFVTLGNDRTLVNSADQPSDWYVQQRWAVEPAPDGGVVLRYDGLDARESWFGAGRYAVVGADGVLRVAAASAAEATSFDREVLQDGVTAAAAAAAAADTAVVVVGSNPLINGREIDDRTSTALADRQQALVEAVQAANPRTVVVLQNSYPTTMPEVDDVPTMVWTSHAGQESGHGLADVLFGEEDPRGRLPQTWYASDESLPDITEYDIARTGMTYQYFEGEVLYPFGYGQSYADLTYSDLRLDRRRVGVDGTVQVSVDVTNTGDRDGSEVVQLYTAQRGSRVDPRTPDRLLQAFERIEVPAGATRTATMTLEASALARWDVSLGRDVVHAGLYDLRVGRDADDTRLRANLVVDGARVPARQLPAGTQAENFDDYAEGVQLEATTREAGTAVSATADGQWVRYRGVDLAGATSVTLRTSRAEEGATTVEVRRGSPTGRLLATVPVPSTGDPYRWTEQTVALTAAAGRTDVVLVARGPVRVDEVSLGREG